MRNHSFTLKIACAFVGIFLADFLFYDEPVGWTLGLFAAFAFMLFCGSSGASFRKLHMQVAGIITGSLVLALIDAPDLLRLAMFMIAMASMIVLHKRGSINNAALWLRDIRNVFIHGFFQWKKDNRKIQRLRKARKLRKIARFSFAIIPLFLTAAFTYLFLQANPIAAQAFDALDLNINMIGELLSLWRWIFWAIVGIAVWAVLRARSPLAKANDISIPYDLDQWLNKSSIIVSLALFNLIFMAQNAMDIIFLWSGKPLPEGITAAEYARAGAYPLIITASLAAAYVLVTFSEYRKSYQSDTARHLVYVWIAQNIFLVSSAIYRNMNAIELYSLTHLRISAMIWMGLIVVGLILIIVRIYCNKSNLWLINRNMATLMTTLYVCCFINFDAVIANYNVRHAREVTGAGNELDLYYMESLGPSAIPALQWFAENIPHIPRYADIVQQKITNTRSKYTLLPNWRSWTWRNERALSPTTTETSFYDWFKIDPPRSMP